MLRLGKLPFSINEFRSYRIDADTRGAKNFTRFFAKAWTADLETP